MKTKQKNELDLLQEINNKLDMLVALTAAQGKDRDEQIRTLAGLSFTNADISRLLGIPKGTVDVVRAKKKSGKK